MKVVKLLLIAIILIGAVLGLIYLNSSSDDIADPEFSSAQANMWKHKINALCKDGAWTQPDYTRIETGIHTDRVTSKGDLITLDEENSLQKYLFASSCSYVKDGADKLFQESSYPNDKLTHYEDALNFLKEKIEKFGGNSNLTEASNLYSAYHQIMAALSLGSTASYSRPLKAYNGGSADGRKNRILSSPYYKSHFSKNSSFRAKIETLDSDMRRAEEQYYSNLEKCVEEHYRTTGKMEELLEDQIHFDEISTNSSAKNNLKNFVNNSYD